MIARDAFMRKVSTRCFVALLAAACAPELADDTTLVTAPRVIAAVADPPELHPRAMVQIHVVPAPDAAGATPELTFCTTPATIGDPRPVSEACLAEKGIPLSVDGLVATGAIPADTCSRFGPDPISSSDRPRDPDATGGFYQPVRISFLGAISFEQVRIQCALPDAPADLARQLADRYRPNQNPHEPSLELQTPGGFQDLAAVKAGESVQLRVRWDRESRETYVSLPPDGTALENRVEAMSVSWFSNRGSFAASVTGRAEKDPGNDTTNSFVAPDSGPLTLWVVLRDSRGGSAFLTRSVHVE
ncbi:MAG TPA: hypothetical protein VHC69_13280 [Polyangiaceae bacterium]|nr:hypothetical protein [Polyangiaceae bacterium]